MNSTYKKCLFLWLPSGRDAFGRISNEIVVQCKNPFVEFNEKVKSNVINDINGNNAIIEIERRIAKRIDLIISKKWMRTNEPYGDEDGFKYLKYDLIFNSIFFSFSVYSSGLYIWEFPNTHDECYGEHFLKSFVAEFISKLFDFTWVNNIRLREGGESKTTIEYFLEYDGILNYFQMEMLVNNIFNVNALPTVFFGLTKHRRDIDTYKNEEHIKNASDTYSVGNIIMQLFLFTTKNKTIMPLYDNRKPYEMLGSLRADIHFLAFPGMEHFLRVSQNYGLVSFREGLEFCRKSIVRDGFTSRISKTSGQVYPPSLRDISPDYQLIEAYVILLSSKTPSLHFLLALLDDTKSAYEEYFKRKYKQECSHSSFSEAFAQFKRHVNSVCIDIDVVSRFLSENLQHQVISELTDIRKVSEFGFENKSGGVKEEHKISLGNTTLSNSQLKVVSVHLAAAFGLIASLPLIFISSYQIACTIESFYPPYPVNTAIIFALAFYFAYLRISKKNGVGKLLGVIYKFFECSDAIDDAGDYVTCEIYDFSSIRQELNGLHGENKKTDLDNRISQIIECMPNPDNSHLKKRAKRLETFFEVTVFNIAKYKYSIWSDDSDDKLSYIIHFEIIYQKHAGTFILSDLRLVLRGKSLSVMSLDNVSIILSSLIRVLVCFDGDPTNVESEYKNLFKKHLQNIEYKNPATALRQAE